MSYTLREICNLISVIIVIVIVFFTGLVLFALIAIIIHAHNYLLAYKLGMMTRTLMTGVIYEKVYIIVFYSCHCADAAYV